MGARILAGWAGTLVAGLFATAAQFPTWVSGVLTVAVGSATTVGVALLQRSNRRREERIVEEENADLRSDNRDLRNKVRELEDAIDREAVNRDGKVGR